MANERMDQKPSGTAYLDDIVITAHPTTGAMTKVTVAALLAASTNRPGADVTPPTVVSATVENANPNQVVVVFSESVTVTTAGWSFRRNGSNWAITSVAGSGTTWTFTMATSAANGETLDRSYNSATGATVDGSANELASFTNSSVTNGISGTIHNSTFTAANSTAITAYTPETGNAWTNALGTWEIQSNKATPATVSSSAALMNVELGATQYTITAVAARVGTGVKLFISFRLEDANNKMYIDIQNNDVKLHSYVAGVDTVIGSTVNPSPSINDTADHTYVLTVGSTTCSLTIDGNPVFTGRAIDAALTGTIAQIGGAEGGSGFVAGDITVNSFNVV